MAPPEGLLIGNPRKPWRVGRVLGSGVCGTVHELTRDGSSMQYVVKAAPLPPPSSNRKKKKTAAEKNKDILYYESLMYQTHFPHLQGKLLPRAPYGPSAPPFFFDDQGFSFLVMERMGAPLMDIVPSLKAQRRKAGAKVPFGPIAVALIDCVQAIHEGRYLFVDVKPENFMLASKGKSLADRIRMLDLGLFRPLRDCQGKLAPNSQDAQLVGTPLYSSLNVHEGHTLSRRDDLEALGYVIAELLIGVVGMGSLPWSQGTSDDDIFEIKKREVLDYKSAFYESMSAGGNTGKDGPAYTMWKYFKAVREIGYKEIPDYLKLKCLVKGLRVNPATSTKGVAKVAAGKRSPPRSSKKKAAKQVVVDLADYSSEESDVEITFRVTRSSRGKKRSSPRARTTKSEEELEVEEDVPSKARRVNVDEFYDSPEESPEVPHAQATAMDMSDSEAFESCQDDNESMDWVAVPDENAAPANRSPGAVGVKMTFTEGPHQGESFLLLKDSADTFVVGSNPQSRNGNGFKVSKDPEVDASHVKFVLHVTKQLCAVRVTDLKSSTGTFVNGVKVPKDRQAFLNDKIRFGDSTLKIQKMSLEDDVPKKKAAAREAPARKRVAAKKDPPKEAKAPGLGVRVLVVSGPHEGESFLLQKGVADTIVVGTNPKAKSSEVFQLSHDAAADVSHAKLELISASKKLYSVKVTDLKSDGGTFVNGKMIPKGKNRQVFLSDKLQVGDSIMEFNKAI